MDKIVKVEKTKDGYMIPIDIEGWNEGDNIELQKVDGNLIIINKDYFK